MREKIKEKCLYELFLLEMLENMEAAKEETKKLKNKDLQKWFIEIITCIKQILKLEKAEGKSVYNHLKERGLL